MGRWAGGFDAEKAEQPWQRCWSAACFSHWPVAGGRICFPKEKSHVIRFQRLSWRVLAAATAVPTLTHCSHTRLHQLIPVKGSEGGWSPPQPADLQEGRQVGTSLHKSARAALEQSRRAASRASSTVTGRLRLTAFEPLPRTSFPLEAQAFPCMLDFGSLPSSFGAQ